MDYPWSKCKLLIRFFLMRLYSFLFYMILHFCSSATVIYFSLQTLLVPPCGLHHVTCLSSSNFFNNDLHASKALLILNEVVTSETEGTILEVISRASCSVVICVLGHIHFEVA